MLAYLWVIDSPQHPAYGSRTKAFPLHVHMEQGKAHCDEIPRRECVGQRWATAEPPRAMVRLAGIPCKVPTNPASFQFPVSSPTPLFPQVAAKPPLDPSHQFAKPMLLVGVVVILPPSSQVVRYFPHNLLDSAPPSSPCQLPNMFLETPDALVTHIHPAFLPAAEPQQRAVPRSIHSALALVDFEFQLPTQEVAD